MNYPELELTQNFPVQFFACDEVGRGPLAGPVVAAAVSVNIMGRKQLIKLLHDLRERGVNDSKKLTQRSRQGILAELALWPTYPLQQSAHHISVAGVELCCAWSEISPAEIDSINILRASLKAMQTACEVIDTVSVEKKIARLVLIDGNKSFDSIKLNAKAYPLVKGDARSPLIGLASVLAKEIRDELMNRYHQQYPQYGLNQHAGYPTKAHREAIEQHGPSPIHRKTFKGVREWLS